MTTIRVYLYVTGNHQAAVRTQPDGEEPEGSRTQIISVKVYPVSGSGQVRVLPATSGGSAPSTGETKSLNCEKFTSVNQN